MGDDFREQVIAGIPDEIPDMPQDEPGISHAPPRRQVLTPAERALALRNALRYFPAKHHEKLAGEFAHELATDGRIYMRRYRPRYRMHARPITEYPARCTEGCRDHAHDHEQPRSRGRPAPARADHVRRQRHGVPELGAVPAHHEVPVPARPRSGAGPVLRASLGLVPRAAVRPACGGDQRHGHPQLLQTDRLRATRGVGRNLVRPDDRRVLHVHRPARDRARHDHHDLECGEEVPPRRRRCDPRQGLRDQRARGDERCAGESGG